MEDFQPMKANFGILPPLESAVKTNKRQRAAMYAERSLQALTRWAIEMGLTLQDAQVTMLS